MHIHETRLRSPLFLLLSLSLFLSLSHTTFPLPAIITTLFRLLEKRLGWKPLLPPRNFFINHAHIHTYKHMHTVQSDVTKRFEGYTPLDAFLEREKKTFASNIHAPVFFSRKSYTLLTPSTKRRRTDGGGRCPKFSETARRL